MAMPMLKYGQTGQDVKTLQMALNTIGYGLVEDGIFGQGTMAAVKDYQGRAGLAVDGIVGDQTWGALLLEASKQQGVISVSSSPSSSSPNGSSTPTSIPNLSLSSGSGSLGSQSQPINWTRLGMVVFVILGVIYFMQEK